MDGAGGEADSTEWRAGGHVSQATDPVVTGVCLNCGSPLTGEYCASCGQRRPHPDPTLREFVHETTHELTDWDGKVPTVTGVHCQFRDNGLRNRDDVASSL